MKAKKLLSTVVASTVVAAQMAMPVMADGGSIETDVTVKTGIVRVQVPTSMAIAIDQFEINHTGSQIAAGEFTMKNLSEMDVKVSVTSTATLGSGISLVSTAEAAENSTKNEAWLGVAAMTADKVYDDPDTDDTEDYWDLTDANSNVTSFSGTSAKQTFYLEKASGSAVYKLAEEGKDHSKKTYAKFYKLESLASTPADDDALQEIVNENDVYVVVNTAEDDDTITKINKGDTVNSGTLDTTNNTYYTAADSATEVKDFESGKSYVYASMSTAGTDGEAGFTYIGKLSGSKDAWSNTDISKIKIAYDIVGITGTNYEAVKDDCTYGLYAEKSIFSFTELSETKNEVVVSNIAANATVSKVVINRKNGTAVDITANTTGAPTVSWLTKEVDGDLIFKVSATIIANANNAGSTIEVEFSDGNKGTLTIPEN